MASGDSIGFFVPGPGVGSASSPVAATMTALANNRYGIQFGSGAASGWWFEWIVPSNYSNTTGITVSQLWWHTPTGGATTGAVIWTVDFELITIGGTAFATDNFNSANNDAAASTTNATAGLPNGITSFAIAKGSTTTANVVAGSRAAVRVRRRLAAGDTLSGTAIFQGLLLTDT